MDIFLSHRSVTEAELYNCSIRTEEEMRVIKSFRRPLRGITAFAFGSIMMIVYILCLQVMLQPKNFRKACYKIMFFLGLNELVNVIITDDSSLAYSLTFGITFCDLPNVYYCVGCFHLACWCGASYFCLYLAFNRILEILNFRTRTIHFFFSPNRTVIGCLLGVLYSLYFLFCSTPVVYANSEGTNVLDPLLLLGKIRFKFRYKVLMLNNVGLVVFTCLLYGYFCIIFRENIRKLPQFSIYHNRLQYQVFLQATLLCAFNFIFSVSFTSYLFIPRSSIFPKIVFIIYQYTIGFQALIYFFCNQTLQSGVMQNVIRMYRRTSKCFAVREKKATTSPSMVFSSSHSDRSRS